MSYVLKHPSKKTGKATVFARYVYEGKEILKSTGVSLLPEHFDKKSGKVSKQDKEHADKYSKIRDVHRALEVAAQMVVHIGGKPTAEAVSLMYEQEQKQHASHVAELDKVEVESLTEIEQLKLEIPQLEKLLAMKKELLHSLQHIYDTSYQVEPEFYLVDKILEYVKLDVKHSRKNTLQGYKNLAVLFKTFKPKLGLNEMSYEVLVQFQQFLIKKGMRNRSVNETIRRLKTIYKYYSKQHKLSTESFSELIMLKNKQNDNIIYLTPEELEELENLELESAHQRQVQKQFLFCCYTGLRFSDIHVNEGNIYNMPIGEDGSRYRELRVAMTKTDKTVYIPLVPKAEAILNSAEFPFKKIHRNHYNKALQTICKKLPILHEDITLTHYVANQAIPETKKKWELISSHAGRKTAINTWLSKGITDIVVSELVGHRGTSVLHNNYQDKIATRQRNLHKMML